MNTSSYIALSDYYDMLLEHDWFYSMSESSGVYRKGSEERAQLQAIAKLSPRHEALFKKWFEYQFSEGSVPRRPLRVKD